METLPQLDQIELLLDSNRTMNAVLKCGICLNFLNNPINCSTGHSWCRDCIGKTGSEVCPLCRAGISGENYIAREIIDRLLCRCINRCQQSNKSIMLGHALEDSKMDENTGETVRQGCEWAGKLSELTDHLEDCQFQPCACPFALHGCHVELPRVAMDAHQISDAHEHIALLSNKLTAMQAQILATQAKNAQIDAHITALESLSHKIRWKIRNIAAHMANKKTVYSDKFYIRTPGRGVYAMKLEACFGIKAHKILGIYIHHVNQEGYCNVMPISLKGTSGILQKEKESTMSAAAVITAAGSAYGWPSFCNDIFGPEIVVEDSIEIAFTILIGDVELAMES